MRRLFKAALAATIALGFATSAFAQVRIYDDPGGEVDAYIQKYQEIRDSGQQVAIDGRCLSACTLLTGIVPRDHVCVTARAVLGFHAASYYNEATNSLVPTRRGSKEVMRLYPSHVQAWIKRHGGLKARMIEMRGRDLASIYHECRW